MFTSTGAQEVYDLGRYRRLGRYGVKRLGLGKSRASPPNTALRLRVRMQGTTNSNTTINFSRYSFPTVELFRAVDAGTVELRLCGRQ